jgi:hypothetical protein
MIVVPDNEEPLLRSVSVDFMARVSNKEFFRKLKLKS